MNNHITDDRSERKDMDCLDQMALAMAYVPWQYMSRTYDPEKALMSGTIFPELDKRFTGRSGGRR